MKPLLILLYASVVSVFSQPLRLDIFPYSGPPAPVNNAPYPSRSIADTVTAGDTLPLVAKLFDYSYAWLPGYETPAAPVTWKVALVSGNGPGGELVSDSGCCTGFIATRGYTGTWVIATFDSAGTVLSDTILVYAQVNLPPVRLVVELAQGSISPNQYNPVSYIHLGPVDATDLYALYRDQYGNFVAPCSTVEWRVLNPSLVELSDMADSIGKVTVRMREDSPSGQTYLFALSCAACTDTAAVGVVVFQPLSTFNIPQHRRDSLLPGMPQSARYYDLRGKLLRGPQSGIPPRIVVVADDMHGTATVSPEIR
jgi:hypothetical protein